MTYSNDVSGCFNWCNFDSFPLIKTDCTYWIGDPPPVNNGVITTGYSYTVADNLWVDQEYPKSEQYEDDKGNLVMRVALAGYPKKNISIEYADNILHIKAAKIEDEHKSLCIAKRAFTKEFVDSKGMWDYSKMKVTYIDGLLTLVIPRKKEKKLVRVEIE